MRDIPLGIDGGTDEGIDGGIPHIDGAGLGGFPGRGGSELI